jgi:hypothetical protein
MVKVVTTYQLSEQRVLVCNNNFMSYHNTL